MNKEDLIEMGLTQEQADKVMKALDGNFVTKARFNEVNGELKKAKDEIIQKGKQLEESEKTALDSSALSKLIADLQKANADQKQAHEKEIAELKLNNAVEMALAGAKVKNIKAVRALLDGEKIKLGDDGALTGLDEQITALKKSDGYMFESESATKFKGFTPGASGDVKPDGKPDLSTMSYDEICAYLNENPDAV